MLDDLQSAPIIPDQAAHFQISQANSKHHRHLKVYHLYQMCNEALKKTVTSNMHEMNLATINVDASRILDLITYLKNRYYKITSVALMQNNTKLYEAWQVETPIKEYFQRIKMCSKLAKDTKEEYLDINIIQIMCVQM